MVPRALVAAAEVAGEHHTELPMPPEAYGAIALGGFFVLFLVTWAFRSVSTKH